MTTPTKELSDTLLSWLVGNIGLFAGGVLLEWHPHLPLQVAAYGSASLAYCLALIGYGSAGVSARNAIRALREGGE